MDMTEPIRLHQEPRSPRRRPTSWKRIGNPTITISYVEADRNHEYIDVYARLLCESPEEDLQAGNGHYRLSLSLRSGMAKSTRLGAMNPRDTALFAYAAECIHDGVMDMVGLGRQSPG